MEIMKFYAIISFMSSEAKDLYAFKAREGRFQLPHEACQILENIFEIDEENYHAYKNQHVGKMTDYLLRLLFVADADKNHGLQFAGSIGSDDQDATSIDDIIKKQRAMSIAESDWSKREIFEDVRRQCFEHFGEEQMLNLERILGIDSRGIDSNDRNPFLGAKIHFIGAASTYCENIITHRVNRKRVLDGIQETHAKVAEIIPSRALVWNVIDWIRTGLKRLR